ncbi:MAG: TonB-dependent receptor [Bacteroidales bacterium]|nr:TonB-dependent receptor [Bacteroidales bacterium]
MTFLKRTIFIVLLFASKFSYSADVTTDVPTDPTDAPSDTIVLEEIEITANRLINFTTGAKVHKIKSLEIESYTNNNLSNLLSEITGISVKSYGMSGLSNVSLRGMSSKHVAVLWNGLNLQNTLNGGTDMSSIPSFLIDEIDIQYGGASALFGSGAIGGIIHLNNNLNFDKKLNIQYNQSFESFDNYFEGLKFSLGKEKFASNTRIYHKYGKNDFKFINSQQFGHPTLKQENSTLRQYGILQSNAIKINNNNRISTNIWAQHHYLEIPPIMTNTTSEQNQNTDALRVSTVWNHNREKSSWSTRFYYNYESLVYSNPLIDLISEMDNYSVVGEVENKTSLGNQFLLNSGINNTYDVVKTINYGESKHRNRTALYTSLKYFNKSNSLSAVISAREELVDEDFTPITFSLSSRYLIIKYLNIRTNISRNYNIPTFNDLYWVPGGNPDLKPEDGWSEDLGIEFNHSISSHTIASELSAFNINLNNHVIWAPSDVAAYWMAENVENLWSRGWETSLSYSYINSGFWTNIKLMYSYTKSTYEESENTDESSIGKQLMYIPINKASGELKLGYKWINIRYTHNFVDKRYINKDNSDDIRNYHLANASIGGKIQFNTSDILINFKVNNVWDKTYEVMAKYAMPLRYYALSITYNFNKHLN